MGGQALLISKAIALWLLPPGGIILLAILGWYGRRQRWGRGLMLLAVTALLLLSLAPVRDLLIRPLEMAYPPLDVARIQPGDAIVVLGGGINGLAPEYGGVDFLSEASLMRTAFALSLTKRHALPVWLSGGRPLHEDQQPEAEVMRRWLVANGVNPALLHAENGSNNTWQNAALLKPLLRSADVRRVILVTTAWHMPRAVWSFEQAGIVVVPAPCDYSSSQRRYTILDWFPDAGVFADSADALHEYLGLCYYRLRYGVL